MAGSTITHKAGDTFRRSVVIDDVEGGISAGIPAKGTFVSGPAKIEFTGVVTNDGGSLKFELTADAATTANWLPGFYQGDVSFGTELTTLDSTKTFGLLIERGY